MDNLRLPPSSSLPPPPSLSLSFGVFLYLCAVKMGAKFDLSSTLRLTSSSPASKLWPMRYGATPESMAMMPMSVKMQGDCIEALVGLMYIEGGFPLAMEFLDKLGATGGR